MKVYTRRAAALALPWQVNTINPEGFIGTLLADSLQHSGVVSRAVELYQSPQPEAVRPRGL
jgi:hypothetical protein